MASLNDGSGTWSASANLGNWTADGGSSNVAWTNNPTDIAAFGGSGSTGGTVTLNGNIFAGAIQINGTDTGSYAFTGAGSSTLTLGNGGITVQNGASTATLGGALTLSLGMAQTWTNNSAAGLAINSPVLRVGGSTLAFIQGSAGVISSTTLLNDSTGIVGPWATFGTGASLQYATLNGAIITGYAGSNISTPANIADTSGTANYDLPGMSSATIPVNASADTLRYTGTGLTITPNATGGLTLNGLMAASASGTLTRWAVLALRARRVLQLRR